MTKAEMERIEDMLRHSPARAMDDAELLALGRMAPCAGVFGKLRVILERCVTAEEHAAVVAERDALDAEVKRLEAEMESGRAPDRIAGAHYGHPGAA